MCIYSYYGIIDRQKRTCPHRTLLTHNLKPLEHSDSFFHLNVYMHVMAPGHGATQPESLS